MGMKITHSSTCQGIKTTFCALLLATAMPLMAAPATPTTQAVAAPVWIDVRTPAEYAQGHLPGAINIPLNEIEARIGSVAADKNTPLMLYCRSGNRSGQAQKILQNKGYTQVENKGAYQDLRH